MLLPVISPKWWSIEIICTKRRTDYPILHWCDLILEVWADHFEKAFRPQSSTFQRNTIVKSSALHTHCYNYYLIYLVRNKIQTCFWYLSLVQVTGEFKSMKQFSHPYQYKTLHSLRHQAHKTPDSIFSRFFYTSCYFKCGFLRGPSQGN